MRGVTLTTSGHLTGSLVYSLEKPHPQQPNSSVKFQFRFSGLDSVGPSEGADVPPGATSAAFIAIPVINAPVPPGNAVDTPTP